MSKQVPESWSEYTVIEESEVLEYLFSFNEYGNGKFNVETFCVDVAVDQIDTASFIDFLRRKFPYFVFSADEVKEMEQPMWQAQTMSAYKENSENEGKYGELILFLLVEGLLDLPMISHKISWKQNAVDEVKGSDGLFFGDFEGFESLAIGEAKIRGERSTAIKDALGSTERFHGEEGDSSRDHELFVASNHLSDNLTEEKIGHLADMLTSETRNYRIIHPMFIGYESSRLNTAQEKDLVEDELREEIIDSISKAKIEEYIEEKIEDDFPSLKKHHLIIMLFPVEDTKEFQNRVKSRIYPHASDSE